MMARHARQRPGARSSDLAPLPRHDHRGAAGLARPPCPWSGTPKGRDCSTNVRSTPTAGGRAPQGRVPDSGPPRVVPRRERPESWRSMTWAPLSSWFGSVWSRGPANGYDKYHIHKSSNKMTSYHSGRPTGVSRVSIAAIFAACCAHDRSPDGRHHPRPDTGPWHSASLKLAGRPGRAGQADSKRTSDSSLQ